MKACVECVHLEVEHGPPCLDCKFYWNNPNGRSFFEPNREDMIQVMSIVESKAREEKAAELEVWRNAYNAALAGCCADPNIRSVPSIAKGLADDALEDYRKKREEMSLCPAR